MQKRLLFLLIAWIGGGAILAARLAFVMLAPSSTVKNQRSEWPFAVTTTADMQRLSLRLTDDGRGRILFRNGQPWTTSNSNSIAQDAGVVGVIGQPDKWPDGKRVVPELGRSGLEYTFDSVLSSRRPAFVGTLKYADGTVGSRLYRINAEPGSDVRTTIDYAWQKTADTLLERYGVHTGAVVIIDTRTNDVIAMASRKTSRPNENVAIQSFTPGSIFKLITAVAAFETYQVQPSDVFDCDGVVHILGVNMRCWRPHGTETFLQAIAESCDVVFATVGVRMGQSPVREISRRLGLEGVGLQARNGIPVLVEAQRGRVYRRSGDDAGLLANSAIGQQDVRLSPLQGANIAAAIANGGRYRDARLVIHEETKQGSYRRVESKRAKRAFTGMTAAKVAEGMRLAVTSQDGTAYALHQTAVEPAVKTGTAELKNGRVNGWMVGFAPYHRPTIAFCVLDADVPANEAHRVVPKIVQGLLSTYKQFHCPTVIR